MNKNLTPDTIYSVALVLDGSELMKMCSTDKETRRICTSEKFNPIWTSKLLKDFNVKYDGNNAYMEYLQHAYLYKQTYWVATVFNNNDNEIVTNKIFKNHSDAAVFLANEAMKYHKRNPHFNKTQYFIYLSVIKNQGKMEDNWNKYEISEGEFETKYQNTGNYNTYISTLKELYDLISHHSALNTDNEKEFNNFREEFELIVSEQYTDDNDFGDEDKENVWERFKSEVLSSYIEGKVNKNIKTAFMKILSIENVYEEDRR